jgi:hypothetical protein
MPLLLLRSSLQKDGFETQFEVETDEAGKLKAVSVTSADGTPCPGPEPRKKRTNNPSNKGDKGAASGDEGGAATTDDDKDAGDGKKDANGKKKNQQRRRGRQSNDATGSKKGGTASETKKPETWEKDLNEDVQKALESKNIKVDGGRAFLAIGDARVKLGTDGYAALAHTSAVLAEGKWTVEPTGVVAVTWERVLKLTGDEWATSTVDAEKAVLLTEIKLADGMYNRVFVRSISSFLCSRFYIFILISSSNMFDGITRYYFFALSRLCSTNRSR